jgi:hypothetical protein
MISLHVAASLQAWPIILHVIFVNVVLLCVTIYLDLFYGCGLRLLDNRSIDDLFYCLAEGSVEDQEYFARSTSRPISFVIYTAVFLCSTRFVSVFVNFCPCVYLTI